MRLIRDIVIVGTIFLTITSSLACSISFTNFPTSNEFPLNTPIVLLTGFEPFSIDDINPSQLIAEALDGQNIDGAEIIYFFSFPIFRPPKESYEHFSNNINFIQAG